MHNYNSEEGTKGGGIVHPCFDIHPSYTHLLILALLLLVLTGALREHHGWCAIATNAFLLQNLSDIFLIYRLSFGVKFEFEARPAHTENLKTVYFRDELWRPVWDQLWVGLHKDMGKAGPKISAIYVKLLGSWNVDVLAPRTIDLYSRSWEFLGYSNGKHILSFAQHSRAIAEWAKHIFFLHHWQTSRWYDKARMNEPVQVHSRLIDL